MTNFEAFSYLRTFKNNFSRSKIELKSFHVLSASLQAFKSSIFDLYKILKNVLVQNFWNTKMARNFSRDLIRPILQSEEKIRCQKKSGLHQRVFMAHFDFLTICIVIYDFILLIFIFSQNLKPTQMANKP